jgi:hypothetical protein
MTTLNCLTKYFIDDYTSLSNKIIEKIKLGKCEEIFNGICKISGDCIIIDYIYFKHFATLNTYHLITNVITNNIDIILQHTPTFTVHVNMKTLAIRDIDTHKTYIQTISEHLKHKYNKKLLHCYIYNSSYIFTHMYTIISMFIDKETQSKIHLIKHI